MNRYNTEQRKVTPIASPSQTYQITPAQAQQLDHAAQAQMPVIIVDQAFQPQSTIKETTGPMERSKALIVRLLPVTAIYLVLSLALAFAFNVALVWAFVGFAALTWWSYYTLDSAERYDSATGVEHHRIDAAERLASQKMEYDAQIRREITQAYLKQLGSGDK
jgi:hypothetical protein